MEEESKFGKITPSMRATGSTIEQMEGEDLSTLMETSTKASGRMIKLMVREFIQKMMAQVTQENGLKIYSMDLASKDGLMVHPTRGTSSFIQ